MVKDANNFIMVNIENKNEDYEIKDESPEKQSQNQRSNQKKEDNQEEQQDEENQEGEEFQGVYDAKVL